MSAVSVATLKLLRLRRRTDSTSSWPTAPDFSCRSVRPVTASTAPRWRPSGRPSSGRSPTAASSSPCRRHRILIGRTRYIAMPITYGNQVVFEVRQSRAPASAPRQQRTVQALDRGGLESGQLTDSPDSERRARTTPSTPTRRVRETRPTIAGIVPPARVLDRRSVSVLPKRLVVSGSVPEQFDEVAQAQAGSLRSRQARQVAQDTRWKGLQFGAGDKYAAEGHRDRLIAGHVDVRRPTVPPHRQPVPRRYRSGKVVR